MYRSVAKIIVSVILSVTLIGAFSVEVLAAKTPDTKDPYADLAIAKVSSSLNIRKKSSTTAAVVGKLSNGAVATVLAKGKVWSKIESGTVTGYVKNEYILTGSDFIEYANTVCKQKATVTASTLRIRSRASLNSEVLRTVNKNTELSVNAVGIKWVKINLDQKNGYVSKEFVSISYDFKYATPVGSDESSIESNNPNTNTSPNTDSGSDTSDGATDTSADKITYSINRQEVVDYALQFVGNPYVYGGTSLTKGADCSGFLYTIFGKFGAKLHRTAVMQSTNGVAVAKANIQPADLIFYGKNGVVSHVAMYIGSGQVVHAQNSKNGICISDMNYGTIICIRSVID